MEYKIYTLAPGESCPSGWDGGKVLPNSGSLLATAPTSTTWPVDGPSAATEVLADVQEYRKSEVWGRASQEITDLITGYNMGSMALWKLKLEEAQAAIDAVDESAADIAAPTLKIEADKRGIDTKTLANKIKTNSDNFKNDEADIMGNAGKHCDAIDAKTTIQEVIDYDITTGWPV